MDKLMNSTIAEKQHKVFRDQLITIGDLFEFKDQLLTEIKNILKDQVGQTGKKWIKAFEVRQLLDISAGKLQYLRDHGQIPYKKLGGITYYEMEKIKSLMETVSIVKF